MNTQNTILLYTQSVNLTCPKGCRWRWVKWKSLPRWNQGYFTRIGFSSGLSFSVLLFICCSHAGTLDSASPVSIEVILSFNIPGSCSLCSARLFLRVHNQIVFDSLPTSYITHCLPSFSHLQVPPSNRTSQRSVCASFFSFYNSFVVKDKDTCI